MSRHAVWPILSLSTLGTVAWGAEPVSARTESPRREARVEQPRAPDENARLETAVGTFEVNVKNVELLRKLIAGEKVPVQFYAGAD